MPIEPTRQQTDSKQYKYDTHQERMTHERKVEQIFKQVSRKIRSVNKSYMCILFLSFY